LEIIHPVRAFDHDREIILRTKKGKKKKRISKSASSLHVHPQHRSDHHRVLRLEVMLNTYGKHLHGDDRAIRYTTRGVIHARIARDEELGERLHELSRRVGAAPHEIRTLREGAEQFWSAGRREARGA
jgi:hypothetical protein